jgi:rhodanese-related sulfurtransferase
MGQKSGIELINEAKSRVTEVTPEQVREMQQRGERPVLLDCREPNEWNLGRLPGALHIPRGTLETKVEALIPHARKIVVYCASGNRSALAADTLQQMGYTDVASLAGGFTRWAHSGGEVEG